MDRRTFLAGLVATLSAPTFAPVASEFADDVVSLSLKQNTDYHDMWYALAENRVTGAKASFVFNSRTSLDVRREATDKIRGIALGLSLA